MPKREEWALLNEPRKGRQTPTKAYIVPYEKTKGQDAVDIYNQTGRTAQEWQQILMYDLMATEPNGLWTHTKFGYAVPRRNGKNEIVVMREMWGLRNGERILHTAHRTTTSHSSWERLCNLMAKSGLREGIDYKTIKQFGLERIDMLTSDGTISFRTRSSKGGLGEGFDLLIIDEAQEYTTDQESALKYVVSDSRNPQTIFCGTPPTLVSSGTVFQAFRKDVLQGQKENAGWAEWSVPELSDIRDRELWYETNPSLGTILSERSVADEISEDTVDFNIQRLGHWLRYNQKSAISKAEWEEMQLAKLPDLEQDRFFAVKFGHDGSNASLSGAAKTKDGKVFVECIDCRSLRDGVEWMIPFFQSKKCREVIVDGKNGQELLAARMKELKLKAPILPKVSEVIAASAMFEQAIFAKTICHMKQTSVTNIISNCEKRPIGNGGGFGYQSLNDGIDVSILDSLVLAHWRAASAKKKVVQRVSY